jgi:UPF0716 protein FxsA
MFLLALFVAVPLIEIALFIQLGSVLDLGWILLIVVLTAILGTWLVRRQGRGVLRQIQGSMETLRDPTEPLAHGAMILFSGALLLTPGFFTDAVGFLLLVPAVREVAFRWLRHRVVVHTAARPGAARPGDPRQGDPRRGDPRRGDPRYGPRYGEPHPGGPRAGAPRPQGRPDVIEGEYRDVTDERAGDTRRGERPAQGGGSRRPSGWTQD